MRLWLLLTIGLLPCGCLFSSAAPPKADYLALIPWPESVQVRPGELKLDGRIVAAAPELLPLAHVLADELYMLSGRRFSTNTGQVRPGDISLTIDAKLAPLSQRVEVGAEATVRGGEYRAVAMGTASLLQCLRIRAAGITAPHLSITDAPGSLYCGAMVDVARQRHPIEALKPVIEMCRLYKIEYLQLHLTDDQSFTFPSTAYPALGKNGYTVSELRELVKYADDRGVTIVPEIEMPGHSSALVGAMPQLFGARNAATGKYEGLGVINIANPAIYPALTSLITEAAEIFHSSPYIHIGADETNWSAFNASADGQALQKSTGENTGQLFADFINRINAMVKRQGKRTIVWEGFGPGSKVDKDVIVMAWHGSSNPPASLLQSGYQIINVPWTPSVYSTVKRNYDWNIYRLNLNENDQSMQFAPTQQVIGGQMVLWERAPDEALPMLRLKAPARNERVYRPDGQRTEVEFEARLQVTDRLLTKLLYPVEIAVSGLTNADERNMGDSAMLALKTDAEGSSVRYTLDGSEPKAGSPVYAGPITLHAAQAHQVYVPAYYGRRIQIKARCFDSTGSPIGFTTEEVVRNDPFRFKYRLYRAAKAGGSFQSLDDLARRKEFEHGVLGRIGSASLINRGSLALGLTAESTFVAEGDGAYAFTIDALPAARLVIDGKTVCEASPESRSAHGAITLTKGPHPLQVIYFTNDGQVQLDVSIDRFPIRTKHHWEDRGLYEWLVEGVTGER